MRTQIVICLAPASGSTEPLSNTIAESWIETELSKAIENHSRAYWTKRNGYCSDCDGFRIVRRFEIPSEEANERGTVIARAIGSFLENANKGIEELGAAIFRREFDDHDCREALEIVSRAIAARRTIAAIKRVGKHLTTAGQFDFKTFDLSLGIPFLGTAESILGYPSVQVLPARVNHSWDEAVEAATRELHICRDFSAYQPNFCAPSHGFIIDLHH